jgi:hypothetical protein
MVSPSQHVHTMFASVRQGVPSDVLNAQVLTSSLSGSGRTVALLALCATLTAQRRHSCWGVSTGAGPGAAQRLLAANGGPRAGGR